MASGHLEMKKEGIMYIKTCLMVNLETINEPKGQGASEDIVPSGGLVGTMGSAGVIARGTTPLMCLCSNINKGVVAKCLSEAGEGAWVTIQIPNDKHRPSGLQGNITENGLNE